MFISGVNDTGDKLLTPPTNLSTVEAGQALAVLYSEARLYKGPSLAGPSQAATTRSTGNISMWIKKVGHSNTRGTVSSLFFPAQNNCCT